jgi:NAD(P)-dependent dehydrogenase (short-subunit alcohol dehydrogenase family)
MPEQNTLPPQTQGQQPGRETEMHPRPDYAPRFPGSGRLDDKVAIVTGGDSGIGRAVAVLFAREGANVAIMYLNEGEDARETERLVKAEGRDCLAIAGDVGDAGFCEKAVEQVIDRFGRLDVLVNNAAEQHPQKGIDKVTPEQIERTFRTNIFGYFFMTQAALPHLKKGAAIVNTTSVTAYRGSPELLDYSATKGAIVAFTRSLAKKLVEKGIRVNGVAPGPIWTPLIPSTFDAKHVASFGSQTPMKRPGQPREVAPSFLFLACEDSSYITGSVLHPNGGEPTES